MSTTVVIAVITAVAIVATVLFKPSVTIKGKKISLYWLIALVGALVLFASGKITFAEAFSGITADTSINPLKILLLFISMTALSTLLDEVGFFRYLASRTLRHAKASQTALFVYLYLTVSILTVFTSNDIIILTFTPFICYFAKHAEINPIPYLVSEFVAANTWSMFLVIGNPTNVYLATANGIGFLEYIEYMAIPTVFGGLTSFLILFSLFRKKLKEPINTRTELEAIEDKPMLIIGVICLSICTLLLAVSSYIGIEMEYIAAACCAVALLSSCLYCAIKRRKPTALVNTAKRAPWALIPFVLSMFVIVLALDKYGVTSYMGKLIGNDEYVILKYGALSTLFANLINNIPMSVLFCSISSTLSASTLDGVFAAIIGSNVGAFLTPIGALAGIMWMDILKSNEVNFSFVSFVKYGIVIAIPTLLSALGGLYISALLF